MRGELDNPQLGCCGTPYPRCVAVYLVSAVAVYSWKSLSNIHEILRVPMDEYLVLAILVLLLWPVAALTSRFTRGDRPQPAATTSTSTSQSGDRV
ncbi:hypothetical protein AB0C07_32020 [Actinoplanes missouriensis]|uniref:hypothetical protein n=1 Tax=Actinoplanes missouriensis TaxID=1866 RepID=UPI0033FC8D59